MKRPRAWFLAAALGAIAGCGGSTASSGDRVLVSKAHYETGLKQPQRYDVVVFKYPAQPLKNNVPTNYIKRLLGLPGEIIAIFFGRLFRFAPPQGVPPFQDHNDPLIDGKTLWRNHTRENDPESVKLFDAGRFEILRKPPAVMMALRRIVYDNDHQAKDMAAFPRWTPGQAGSGWTAADKLGFRHAGAKGPEIDWLRYRHLIRPQDGKITPDTKLRPQLITDALGYNSYWGRRKTRDDWERELDVAPLDHTPAVNWVGDLMLECQVEAAKGEGEVWLELSKGVNRFQARFDLGSGMCTLYKTESRQIDANGKTTLQALPRVELDSQPTKLRGPGAYHVRFANFDARLTVWVDRELPFGDGKDYPPPEVRSSRDGEDEDKLDVIDLKQRRGPTANDLEPASIGVVGADVQVRKIQLWRDIYYTLRPGLSDVAMPDDLSDQSDWSKFRNMEYKTIYVQPGHYLCLGDNSQASSDGRDWGLVPERLMLGRALMVYYPFNRAGPIR